MLPSEEGYTGKSISDLKLLVQVKSMAIMEISQLFCTVGEKSLRPGNLLEDVLLYCNFMLAFLTITRDSTAMGLVPLLH